MIIIKHGKIEILAYDEKGNEFKKEVKITESTNYLPNKSGHYGIIISFGWSVEYYINALLKNYPYKKPLCIDSGGANHKGSTVFIKAEDLNSLLQYYDTSN